MHTELIRDKNKKQKKNLLKQPCLVVKAVDSRSRGRGVESRSRILDGNCSNAMKEKGENKGSQMGLYAKKNCK